MAVQQANGNQTQAARLLDISRDALRYKLRKFGLIHADEEDTATLKRAEGSFSTGRVAHSSAAVALEWGSFRR